MNPTEEPLARSQTLALDNRYAALARETIDTSAVAALFEPNGTIATPDGRKFTPATLSEIMGGNPPKLLRHHLTTIVVQFFSAEEAQCQCCVLAMSKGLIIGGGGMMW